MTLLEKTITLDFSEISAPDFEAWLKQIGRQAKDIPDLDVTVKIDVDAGELPDDKIEEAYFERIEGNGSGGVSSEFTATLPKAMLNAPWMKCIANSAPFHRLPMPAGLPPS